MHVSSSPSYWNDVNEKFFKKYYGLDATHKRWAEEVVEGRPIVGPLGRFWPVEMKRNDYGELQIPWTVLSNYPVQGTGADVMTIARVTFFKRLKQMNLDKLVLLVSSVHDSIVVDAPSYLLMTITNLFHQVFDDLQLNIKRAFGYNWKVPLACEVKYGQNMKDMKKVDRNDLSMV